MVGVSVPSLQDLIDRWWPLYEAYQPLPPDHELQEELEAEELADRERNKLARRAGAEGAPR